MTTVLQGSGICKGNVIKVFSGHKSGVTSVAFSPDGLKVLTGSQDATARLWDINGNTTE